MFSGEKGHFVRISDLSMALHEPSYLIHDL